MFNQIQNGVVGHSSSNTLFLKVANNYFSTLQAVNGNATLGLTINGNIVSTASLSSDSVDTISLPLQSFIAANNSVPGTVLSVGVRVLNATLESNAARDFRVIASLTYKYSYNASYVPPPPANLTNALTVTLAVGKTPIGLDAQNNKKFMYTAVLQNIMPVGASSSGSVNLAIGAPSCLSLDADFANALVNSGAIVGWEVVDNGVTVLLLRAFIPGEVRTLNIQFTQTNAGTCLMRDNLAYQTNGDFYISASTRVI